MGAQTPEHPLFFMKNPAAKSVELLELLLQDHDHANANAGSIKRQKTDDAANASSKENATKGVAE